MATLTFLGAVDGVTGSMHLLKTATSTVLMDCGLFQGGRKVEASNQDPFPFDATTIHAVVLSHAHQDHSGRLPLLVNRKLNRSIPLTMSKTRWRCAIHRLTIMKYLSPAILHSICVRRVIF